MGIDMRMYRCDHSNELCADLYIHMSNPGLAKTGEVDLPPPLPVSRVHAAPHFPACRMYRSVQKGNKEIERCYWLLHLLHVLHLAEGSVKEVTKKSIALYGCYWCYVFYEGRTPEGHK